MGKTNFPNATLIRPTDQKSLDEFLLEKEAVIREAKKAMKDAVKDMDDASIGNWVRDIKKLSRDKYNRTLSDQVTEILTKRAGPIVFRHDLRSIRPLGSGKNRTEEILEKIETGEIK